jgi:methionyl-tRNA formyltransferase
MTRIVFMGTPSFAVPALRVLLEEGYEIAAVVTQPDRPAGRSGRPRASPVKDLALQHGLPIWQPASLRPPEAVAHLSEFAPDVIVVAAYGQILKKDVLDLPPHACLNLHASLLPRHRGSAPVAAAILAGDGETGVSLMRMDEGMDTGPLLGQVVVPLTGQERRGELTALLAEVGAGLLQRLLPAWLSGQITPQPQDESRATYNRLLRRDDGEIEWSQPARQIERMMRAHDPWPGIYSFLRGRRLRIWKATVLPGPADKPPGTMVLEGRDLVVTTGEDHLRLEEVQLEGKRRLPMADFLRGQRDLGGVRLGRERAQTE